MFSNRVSSAAAASSARGAWLVVQKPKRTPLLRYGDLLAENCVFFLPLSYLAPLLPKFPLEFRGEVNHEETRVMGLPGGESCMILTSSIFD